MRNFANISYPACDYQSDSAIFMNSRVECNFRDYWFLFGKVQRSASLGKPNQRSPLRNTGLFLTCKVHGWITSLEAQVP